MRRSASRPRAASQPKADVRGFTTELPLLTPPYAAVEKDEERIAAIDRAVLPMVRTSRQRTSLFAVDDQAFLLPCVVQSRAKALGQRH